MSGIARLFATLLGAACAGALGVAVLMLALPPVPQKADATMSFGPEDVHAAIRAQDAARLNAGLALSQSEFRAGLRSADDLRATYDVLALSHPDIVRFVETWAAAEPTHPNALISRARSLHGTARRNCCADSLDPDGATASMMDEAERLALKAYRLAPDLLPASDAMLGALTPREQSPAPPDVLDAVLRDTPNLGSIDRGIDLMKGRSAAMVHTACADLAKNFADPARSARFCVVRAAVQNGPDALRTQLVSQIWEPPWYEESNLDRLELYLTSDRFLSASEGHFIWVRHVPEEPDPDQADLLRLNRLAKLFEERLQNDHGVEDHPHSDFLLSNLDRAEQLLQHDPRNADLIDMVAAARRASSLLQDDPGTASAATPDTQAQHGQDETDTSMEDNVTLAWAEPRVSS